MACLAQQRLEQGWIREPKRGDWDLDVLGPVPNAKKSGPLDNGGH
jgi:hypothetical protein